MVTVTTLRRRRWVQNGRCYNCGRPRDGWQAKCQLCRDRSKERKLRMIDAMRCVNCGDQVGEDEPTVCKACRVRRKAAKSRKI